MSTKRQRREGPSSAPADHSSELPLLTSVSVVCRDATSQLQSLPHVISAINGFVDVTHTRSVEFACSIGSVRLLQRIIAGYEQQQDTSEKRDPLFRQIRFSRGMKAACEAGQLIIVQWLARSPYFGACFMPTQAVCNAVRLGHMGVLEWLHANRTDICWRRTLKAVNGNHLDAAKWLQPMAGHHQSYGRRWIIPAAQVGNLEMVKWAYNLIGETPGLSREATEVASDNGRVHVVQWLLEQTGTNAPKHPDASGLLSKGGMEALEMLLKHVDNLPQECWVIGQVNAISSGHRDVAERLFTMGFELELAHEDRFSRAISTAAGKGHLDVLKWLAEHEQNLVFTSASMDSAALGGKLDVLQWLSGNCAEDCTETGVAWAAKNGHLDVLRWLHENKPNGFSKKTMDEAASNNHTEVVEWLHTNRREGCTTTAMDGAANSGHLEMVKWLHSNRSEGCTTTAMDQAARNGHLEMVKWLHANRSEGCSPMAMDEAAGCGHLDVVKWLYDNCTEGSIASAIMSVVDTHPDQGGGNGSVMEWLLDRRTEDCTAYEMDAAARNSNLEAILPLHRQGNGSCTSDAISFVYLYARGREFLPWFYANYPDQAVMSLIPEEEEKLLLTSATEYRDQLISQKQSSDKSKPGPRDEE